MEQTAGGSSGLSKLPVPAKKKKVTVPREFSFATSSRANRAPIDSVSNGHSVTRPHTKAVHSNDRIGNHTSSNSFHSGKLAETALKSALKQRPSASQQPFQTANRRPFSDATNRNSIFPAPKQNEANSFNPVRRSQQPSQQGIVFEADPTALRDILSGKGVSEMSIYQPAASRITGNFTAAVPRKSLGAPIRRLPPSSGAVLAEDLRRKSVFVGGAQRLTTTTMGRPSMAPNLLSRSRDQFEDDFAVGDDNEDEENEDFAGTDGIGSQQIHNKSQQFQSSQEPPMSKFEKSMNGYFARQQQQQSQPPPSSQNAPPLTPAAKREMLINRAGLAMLELANTPRSQRFQLAPPPLNAATSLTNNSKFQHQEPAPSSRIWPAEKTEMELYLRSLPPLPDSPDIPAPPTPIIAAAAAAATEESVEKNLKPPLLASEAANPASPAIVTDLNSINIPPPPPPLLAAASGNTNPHQPLLPSTANTNEDDTCALFFATAPRSGTGFDPLHLRQETPQRQLQDDSSDTGGDFDTPTSEERRCILRELERLNELEAQILAEMNEDDLKIPQATTSIPTVATASQRRFFTLDDFGRRI